MPLANTDGPRDKHTKGSMWAITYTWTLKYDTNELTYETETDSQRTDLWLPNGQGKDALEIQDSQTTVAQLVKNPPAMQETWV